MDIHTQTLRTLSIKELLDAINHCPYPSAPITRRYIEEFERRSVGGEFSRDDVLHIVSVLKQRKIDDPRDSKCPNIMSHTLRDGINFPLYLDLLNLQDIVELELGYITNGCNSKECYDRKLEQYILKRFRRLPQRMQFKIIWTACSIWRFVGSSMFSKMLRQLHFRSEKAKRISESLDLRDKPNKRAVLAYSRIILTLERHLP